MSYTLFKSKRDQLFEIIKNLTFDKIIDKMIFECQNTIFQVDDSAYPLTPENFKNERLKAIEQLRNDIKFKELFDNAYAFNLDTKTLKHKLKESLLLGINTVLENKKIDEDSNVIYFVYDYDYCMDILLCNNEKKKFDDYHSYHVIGEIICEIDDFINYFEWFEPVQIYMDYNDFIADSDCFDDLLKLYKYNFFYFLKNILSELDTEKILPEGFHFYISEFDCESFLVYKN